MSVASRLGGDAEVQRRKFDRRQEAAATRVGSIGGLGVGVAVIVGPPVSRRDIGDGIEPVADIGPERARSSALGNRQPMPMIATGTGCEQSA